jgi:periplasmic divalent cation tolerance protein
MTNVVLVLTTVPEGPLGDLLARTLIEEHLAACVNIHGPMGSVYRWQGVVDREIERQLVIKTTEGRVEAIRARIAELHSYELPEFLVVPVSDGASAYLEWVQAETI